MKKITVYALFLTTLLAIAPVTQAWADPTPGWYAGLGAILNDTMNANAHFNGNQNVLNYDLGWGVEGSGGYSFQNGMRLEGEVAHIRAGVKSIQGGTGGSGTLADTDFFANAFYDFRTGTMWTPYIGGGAGMAVSDGNSMGTLANGSSMNDEQIVFAYQAIVGASAQLTPRWAVTADYRYIATSNPRFSTTPTGGNATIDNQSHNIVVSVRYSFKPPEPTVIPEEVSAPVVPTIAASQPVVAPVPQSYMVFFDFDKSTLTPEAQRIIASAAQEFKRGGYVKIVVTGHTDSVGTVSYNQKLSERRAAAVRAEFAKLGVSTTEIAAQGVGKSGQLVPTADQVREAQNRRAEIVFNKQ